jgi:hypothetical protein
MPTEISPNASVKLDGSGNGQVSLTPPSGTVWRLRLANVSTTGTVNQPKAFLYRGSTSGPVEQIDSTFLGNSASSAKVAGAPFFQGQVLWAKWTGGDANAQATLQVYGQQATRGEGPPFDQAAVGEGFPLTVATVFQAGNTIINSSGDFVYSAAPAAGDLVASIAGASGTDPYTNAYLAGIVSYGAITNQAAAFNGTYAVEAGVVLNAGMGIAVRNQTTPSASDPSLSVIQGGASGISVTLASGIGQVGGTSAAVSVNDSLFTGITDGVIDLNAGRVFLGNLHGSNCFWDDNAAPAGNLLLGAGAGPFISGETFHTVTNATGFSGTMRVKKLPWNAIWLDVEVTVTSAGGASFAFGSLPDSTYYPTGGRHFPLSLTGANVTGAAFAGLPRVHMPTSGAVAIEIPTLSANAALSLGLSVMYPTN